MRNAPRWSGQTATRGGPQNCNNVSSPLLAGRLPAFRHHGRRLLCARCGQGQAWSRRSPAASRSSARPWSAATGSTSPRSGSRVYALEPERQGLLDVGLRQGADSAFAATAGAGPRWRELRDGRVSQREQFLCSRDIALDGRTLVVPAGGCLVWLEDAGRKAELRRIARPVHVHPRTEHRRGRHRLPPVALAGQRRPGRILRPAQVRPNEVPRPREAGPARTRRGHRNDHLPRQGRRGLSSPAPRANTEGGLLSFCSVSLRGRTCIAAGPRRLRPLPALARREAATPTQAATVDRLAASWSATRRSTAAWTARCTWCRWPAARPGRSARPSARPSPRRPPCATAASISAARTATCTCSARRDGPISAAPAKRSAKWTAPRKTWDCGRSAVRWRARRAEAEHDRFT